MTYISFFGVFKGLSNKNNMYLGCISPLNGVNFVLAVYASLLNCCINKFLSMKSGP